MSETRFHDDLLLRSVWRVASELAASGELVEGVALDQRQGNLPAGDDYFSRFASLAASIR